MEPDFESAGGGSTDWASQIGGLLSGGLNAAAAFKNNAQRRIVEPAPAAPAPPGSYNKLILIGGAFLALILAIVIIKK